MLSSRMPVHFVTYRSDLDSAAIMAKVSAAAADDEMGLYRLFGGRSRYVRRMQPNGFSLYRARLVNRMPATLIATIEPRADGGSTITTWFESKPGWRDIAVDLALILVVVFFGWQSPAYTVPTALALVIVLVTIHIGFRRRWERDRRTTREFITMLLQQHGSSLQ